MSRHINIPIFIPHLGCPNQCVFCNQRTICGRDAFQADSIRADIESVLSTVSPDDECEIAFFGGSFTGIDRGLMVDLLTIAKEYVDKGFVRSVRCSTRPDYINEEIINLLREYSVNTVELGLQSSSDSVLALSKRGHGRIDEERACRLLVDNHFSLVGQMMIGLPGSSLESELETAEFIASVGAEYARIYPTVVFQDTELCEMAKRGTYTPLSLDDAIERSCAVYSYFLRKGVKVIRVGLCSSDNLVDDSKYYAGPNHPALGELVLARVMYYKMRSEIDKLSPIYGKSLTVLVSRGYLSRAIGQHRENINKLISEYKPKRIRVREDSGLKELDIKIIEEREDG